MDVAAALGAPTSVRASAIRASDAASLLTSGGSISADSCVKRGDLVEMIGAGSVPAPISLAREALTER